MRLADTAESTVARFSEGMRELRAALKSGARPIPAVAASTIRATLNALAGRPGEAEHGERRGQGGQPHQPDAPADRALDRGDAREQEHLAQAHRRVHDAEGGERHTDPHQLRLVEPEHQPGHGARSPPGRR